MRDRIREFYDALMFPGMYDLAGIRYHGLEIRNPYLALIDRYVARAASALDIGCGTGYVSNLMAYRHPRCEITGIDFGRGLNYAHEFAQQHALTNASYHQRDFMQLDIQQQFDVVVAQGVLHHIPEFDRALDRAKRLVTDQGILIIGLYHPWGKILKKYVTIDYDSEILEQDQEHHPYEISYTLDQLDMTGFKLLDSFPRHPRIYALLNPLRHSRNGGLVTYVFKNH